MLDYEAHPCPHCGEHTLIHHQYIPGECCESCGEWADSRPMSKLEAFLLGIREYRQDLTTNPGEGRMPAYERGRELAHRLTMRRFEHY